MGSEPLGQVVVDAADACRDVLLPYADRDWREVDAHELEWSVWRTVCHVNDDLYFYAAQIMLADVSDYVCFELTADPHATPARALAALAVNGRLLAAACSVADPGSRSHHAYGPSDPPGFAAMGAVETLVHTYDALLGLDPTAGWRPPHDLAAPVVARLFPDAPSDATDDAGELLLHLCGRVPLGDRPRVTDWRWRA